MQLRDIRVESGTRHTLTWCVPCRVWREVRPTLSAAYTAAADHAARCHQDQRTADHFRARARDTRT